MRIIIATLVLCLVATGSQADESRLKRLDTGVDSRGWEGVGRLDIGGKGFCTGSLVAPDLVLTAAHCLYDKATGRRIPSGDIEFLAGWRNGRALAYRAIRRAIIPPDYEYQVSDGADRVRHDMALLELMQPIRNTQVKPFDTAPHPHRGADVSVVSYAHDRAEAPSLQEVCSVLARQTGVMIMSCDVDFGSSGAPIFLMTPEGPKIVSVVAAKADLNGKQVALGSDLTSVFDELRSGLDMTLGVFETGPGAPQRVIVGDIRRDTGAKFVRP